MAAVHFVALTSDLRRALVIETAVGWLLPRAEARTRNTLISAIDTVLKKLSVTSHLIHWAPVPLAGTTGGRAPEAPDERYCLALVDKPILAPGLTDVPIETLLSSRAALPAQRRAFEAAVTRARHPQQCFDSMEQVTAALRWATQEMSAHANARITAMRPYRCARNDYVVGFETSAGPIYFKSGRRRTSDEAQLCDLLRALAPRQFPATLSTDRDNDRWLYRALTGEVLADTPLTPAAIADIVRALAFVQQRSMLEPAIKAHLVSRAVRARDVLAQASEIVTGLWCDPSLDGDALLGDWQEFASAAERVCDRIDAADIPQTLAFSDFWTANIVVTADGIGFIDVENAYWTYPFVPLWRFRRDVDRQLHVGDAARELIERTFIDAWADLVSPVVMRRALADFPLLGQLFSLLMASRDLDRLEEDIGEPLLATYRASQLRARVNTLVAAPGALAEPPRPTEPA